jgi:hypothetical protein
MSIFANGIFNRATAGGGTEKAKRAGAASGFSQIFTTMLVNKMREAMGSDKGPLGTGGGASGNIYGAFFDQAMGSALAHSKAMMPLNKVIERGLAGPRHPISGAVGGPVNRTSRSSSEGGIEKVSFRSSPADTALFSSGTLASRPAADEALPSDARGPVMLPPAPRAMAPVLPPPPVKG